MRVSKRNLRIAAALIFVAGLAAALTLLAEQLRAGARLTLAEHTLGALACVVLLGSLWYGAVIWRHVLLPGWRGPLACLADTVAVSATLLLLAQALGAVGLFSVVALVVAGAATGGTAVAICAGRKPERYASVHQPAPQEGRFTGVLAPGATAAVVSLYALEALSVLSGAGITEFDSLWYHLPVAADFVQARSFGGLTDVGNPPTSFFPFNGEALHAAGLALLGHDAFSPAINLIWLSIALLAGWSIGLPFGRPRLTLIAVAAVVGTPLLVHTQAGTANVDLMGLAFALAAVAFMVNAGGALWPFLLAFLSIGLVVGTKLPMLPTSAALAVVAIISLPATRRLQWSRWGVICVLLAGSFWYVRNAFHVGNPLPWVGLNVGLLTLPSLDVDPSDCTLTPVIHWLGNRSVLAQRIASDLGNMLGSLWPALLSISVLGAAAAAAFGRRPAVRLLGAVAVFGWIAYLITPASGGEHDAGSGDPTCFAYNLRFAVAPMTLGAVAALLVIPRNTIHVAAAAMTSLVVVNMLSRDPSAPLPHPGQVIEEPRWLLPLVLGGAAGLVALWRSRESSTSVYGRRHRSLSYALLVLCLLGTVVMALPAINRYLDGRYRDVAFYDTPLQAAARWARDVDDANIGVGGFTLTYPLYGLRATNSVSYVSQPDSADPLSRPKGCDEWRLALTDGNFDYVVTTPYGTEDAPPLEAAWTRQDRRAKEIISTGPLSVFSFDASARSERCDAQGSR